MQQHAKSSLTALTLGAIGVVYGDIGTSVLYALKEVFGSGHVEFTPDNVFGILSIFFWTLTTIISVKYVMLVLRADNNGEGGLVAMLALASMAVKDKPRLRNNLLVLGIFGTCLFYGDGVITPAISVLSAVEGLEVVSPAFKRYVIPLTLIILFALFAVQKHGTGGIGKLFGPITVVWFAVIAALGLYHIATHPEILWAISPHYAVAFIVNEPSTTFLILGAVVLCVTGGEALYADMGHFGKKPIRVAWFAVVMPSLTLNYFGQGALLLGNPEAVANPFFMMAPEWLLLPLVGLATAATVIASQAVISGTYSLVSQAILLGFLPRMKIMFTSDSEQGQIYIPLVNWALLFMVVVTIVEFRESVNLAAAYGISVTSTMLITTILLAVVMLREWKMNVVLVTLITATFFIVDLAFWSANLIKIEHGGWYPLALGLICFTCLITWYRGRQILRKRAIEGGIELGSFIEGLLAHPPYRAEGTAVFLTAHVDYLPVSFLHNLKHNHVLHERVFFLKVSIWDVPYVNDDERITLKDLGGNIFVVRAIYGFKETPDMASIIHLIEHHFKMHFDMMNTSFFLSRDTIVPSPTPGMALWRERLFCWMYQNAGRQSDFFNIPANRLVELGAKVEI
jgi:KUP system potassium uptake protein